MTVVEQKGKRLLQVGMLEENCWDRWELY